ncbi:sensor histidine kinase [Luteimonas sp. RIT-PG2_3]
MFPKLTYSWRTPAPDSALASTLRQGRARWTEAVHLLWSSWVFVVPLFTPEGYSLRWLLLTLLSYPLFVALYVAAVTQPKRLGALFASGMIVMCFALMPWYPSGLSYFVFGCVLLGVRRWKRLGLYLLVLAIANAVLLGWARWIGYPWTALAWMPLTTAIIGVLVHVERMGDEKDAALKLSHEEIRRLAALAERERIGRDLHDLLGHTLSMVALKSDLAGRLLTRAVERDTAEAAMLTPDARGDGPGVADVAGAAGIRDDIGAARREIADVAATAREALAQVRGAVSGIRAAGIAAELASAKLLLEIDGVAFDYGFDAEMARAALSPAVETALAMTVREAVTNIQRHAGATRATIAFAVEQGDAVLRVSDDGRGGAIQPGNGLAGMRERLEAARGSLRIDAAKGRGTRLEARLPLAAAEGHVAP